MENNKPPILQFAEFFLEKLVMSRQEMIKALECLEKGMTLSVSMGVAYGLITVENLEDLQKPAEEVSEEKPL